MTSQLAEKTQVQFPELLMNTRWTFAPYSDKKVSAVVCWVRNDAGDGIESLVYARDKKSYDKLPHPGDANFAQKVEKLYASKRLRSFYYAAAASKRLLRLDVRGLDGPSYMLSLDDKLSGKEHWFVKGQPYYYTDDSVQQWPATVSLGELKRHLADPEVKHISSMEEYRLDRLASVEANLGVLEVAPDQTIAWDLSAIQRAYDAKETEA